MADYFFVSYLHKDIGTVQTIINDLKKSNLTFWTDYEAIVPGDNWEQAINMALKNAIGLVVFLSQDSIDTLWSVEDINKTLDESNIPITFVLIEKSTKPIHDINSNYFIDFSANNKQSYEDKLKELTKALDGIVYENDTTLASSNLNGLKSQITAEVILKHEQLHETTIPNAVFLVHGHDYIFLEEVKNTLAGWGIESIILKDEENVIQSIPQNLFAKFHQHSARAKFAIVLMTPDDVGSAIREYEATFQGDQVRDKALQYRSRQNVILEMGFFYGRLGSERVLIIQKHTRGYFPRFERPSDLDGILFDEVDDNIKWKFILYRRLQQEGFNLKPSDYF